MDVRWFMFTGEDNDPKAAKSQDGRHGQSLPHDYSTVATHALNAGNAMLLGSTSGAPIASLLRTV